MNDSQFEKPGRHAEIVPGEDDSYFVLVDGKEWARFDTLGQAESVRNTIVERWAAWYETLAAEITP